MATLSTKPSQRFRLSDWNTNSYLLSTNAERQRDASHQIRQEARVLRNDTNNQVGVTEPWQVGRKARGKGLPQATNTPASSRPFGMSMTTGLGWQRGSTRSTAGRSCWTSV